MDGLKRAAWAAAAVCLVGGQAWAQQTQALPVTPEKLATAQLVVEANGSDALTAKMMDVVSSAMLKGMGVGGDPAIAGLARKVINDEIAEIRIKMRPLYAQAYANVYTDQELSDLLAFYRSPTGRATVSKAPQLMEESQRLSAPLIPAMQRDVVVKLFDQLCTVKPCTPDMRKQIATLKQTTLDRLNAQQSAAAAAMAAMPH
jgi:hypothetical protein